MTDFEKVIDFNNMYRAFRKAKRGKGFKKSAARFDLAALDGVHTLIFQLRSKTYRISDYSEFKVYEPKERVIQTTSFKDKVIQHSLCDNVIMPRLQHVFLLDNCAGQKGKGTLFGLDRLSRQMQQFYSRYGFEGYILKCDISKFFYNISHDQLKDIVHYHFGYDRDICWLCDLFIDSTEGKGIPLGNQINQGFALLYLDGMDKRNAQRKFIRMAKLVADGKLPFEKFAASYSAWKNHISHGDCYRLGQSMDREIVRILKDCR